MSLWNRFLRFEREHNTYKVQINNISVWERIRFSIYRKIQSEYGHGQAHSGGATGFNNTVRTLTRWGKNIIHKNPLLSSSSRCVIMGHSRRKKLEDSMYWDIYVDPFLSSLKLDSVYFENHYQGTHLTPAKTDSIRYTDLIDGLAVVLKKSSPGHKAISDKQRRRLNLISNKLNTTFGVEIALSSMVERLLARRATQLPLFKLLLRRINPQVALVVVGYGSIKQLFTEACQELNIPVIELQHGTIHPEHVGYAFNDGQIIHCFPDYLLSWGPSWTEDVSIPLPENRVIPVGYPFLESRVTKFSDHSTSNQILFVSQGTIGKSLSEFAVRLDTDDRIDSEIIYKLHPGEYDRWESAYPWLAESDVRVIESNNPPLYSLLARSRCQVGVNSTVLYEGLAFDNTTLLYDDTAANVEQRLIDDEVAVKISSVDDVVEAMDDKYRGFKISDYFRSDATQNMCKIIEKISYEGSCYMPT